MLVNPFELGDSHIRDMAYHTHLNDNATCDTHVLYTTVSTLLYKNRLPETGSSSFQPGFHTLKLISTQMINATSGVQYVHKTTMWILEQLKNYSWDAKALLTLAAFAFEIHRIESLESPWTNEVQSRWKVPPIATNLVAWVMEALEHIWEWLKLSSIGYNTEDVPSLSDAFNEIPLLVYWILASLVASVANIIASSDYQLSDFIDRLSSIDNNLKEHLSLIKQEIDGFEDYLRRKEMFSQTKDSVSMLRNLCEPTPEFPRVQVYDGNTKTKKGFEVFKQKHVLLYFSEFNSIDSEILFLNYIHVRLEENPKEVIKGFKKEDFKILWIPIVDNMDDSAKIKLRFETLKSYIRCYAVEHFSKLPGIRLIREKLNYTGKPIMPVLTPKGDIMNEDAKDLIFQWGIEAFPFRKFDGEDLSLKWKWFWDVLKKLSLGIQLEGGKYIFIYQGKNREWNQKLAFELDKIKVHETIKRADCVIEHYQLGKNDHGAISSFWKEIEIKKETKKASKLHEVLDYEIQDKMESLLRLKNDPQGWVILSKGSNVKVLGGMKPMFETMMNFEIWKDKVLQIEGFDIALKEYYDAQAEDDAAEEVKPTPPNGKMPIIREPPNGEKPQHTIFIKPPKGEKSICDRICSGIKDFFHQCCACATD
ncbi:hypothetical protein HN51_028930 [Arachis hypogaea]|uniref:Protein SIEVE ELEMENT OCCLUSION B n=1 Tax=Arachis hypogaea TaxID=3818 RepID=A0A445BGL2_ARAHY|nr:protein SIEVE ELEMENT OCCLUSION B-like [Arachis hypogaea]RYR37789.1 hypothetical protein Ahy_A09g042678 [Arachis hypogaea]